MPSSTFNSKRAHPIAAALFVALFLTALYVFLVPVIFPSGGIPQNQQQENVVSVQDYLYAERAASVVIAGSSKAARLEPSYFPPGYANLAMSGGSPGTGVEIVLMAQKRLPGVLLVEMNDTIMRGVDAGLVSETRPGWRTWFLERLPVFRQRFEPICLLAALSKGKKKLEPVALDDHPTSSFHVALAEQLKGDGSLPGEREMLAVMAAMKEKLSALSAKGVHVVLFDPPSDPEVEASAREQYSRKLTREFFSDFPWVPAVDASAYHTSDGVHLLPGSAYRYAQFLVSHIGQSLK